MNPVEPVVKQSKRGRPRKIIENNILKRGIIEEPTLGNAIMELQYNIPIIFKKIFSLFEQIKIHDLKLEFKNKFILIKTIDSTERNIILLTINCEDMVSYYCKFDFEISIDSNVLQTLLKKIDKCYTDIVFYSTEENYNVELNIILFRSDFNVKEKHVIKITDKDHFEENISSIGNIKFSNNYASYPIQFELNSKFFKKLITDISSISGEFIIEKKYNAPLTVKYKNTQSKIVCKNIFKNAKDIKLVSNQEVGDIYGATLFTTQIKPISSILLSDNIKVYLKQDNNVVFKIDVENSTFSFLISAKIKST